MRTYTHGVIGYLLYEKRPRHEQRLAILWGILPDVFLALGFVAHYLENLTHSAMAASLHMLLHHSALHTVTVALHSFVIVGPFLALSAIRPFLETTVVSIQRTPSVRTPSAMALVRRIIREANKREPLSKSIVKKKTGVSASPNRVTPIMPLKTAVPSVRRISAPAPREIIRGSTPMMKEQEVITIGRSRNLHAARVAS